MDRARFLCLLLLLLSLSPTAAAQELPPLLITEVFYNTPGPDAQEEWVEIANPAALSANLDAYRLGDEEGAGGGEGMLRFPPGATIRAGGVIVVAQHAVTFQQRYGFLPDFEVTDSLTAVPDMHPDAEWSSGRLALANDGDELLLLADDDRLVDAVNYGSSVTYFSPSVGGVFPGQTLARAPAFCDSDTATDWQPQELPDPGRVSLHEACRLPLLASDRAGDLTIGAIQGRHDVSPYINQQVTFRGVVTGIYEDRNTAGRVYHTLFIQDLPGAQDGDPSTSDAIAVFLGTAPPRYAPGDLLQVTGTVTEFFGLTEIDDRGLHLEPLGAAPLPAPMPFDPPPGNAAAARYAEAYESMLVGASSPAAVIGPTHPGCGLAVRNAQPDPEGAPARIVRRHEDDPVGHAIPVLYKSDVDCSALADVHAGDLVTGVSGPLTYNFDVFKIVQQSAAALQVEPAPLPPAAVPPSAADGFSIATFNLDDYFDTVRDTGSDGEPVPTAEELLLKQRKLAHAIGVTMRCPTLVAVQEVEKAVLLEALAEQLLPACGFRYQVVHHESSDTRGIDVALLADPVRVAIMAAQLRQACTSLDTGILDRLQACPSGLTPLFSRPPLEVQLTVEGRPFVVFVNHFKSKRGGADETAPARLAQAQHLAALVEPHLAENRHVILAGDFNDYELSAPLSHLTGSLGFVNALARIPLSERYTFIFDGAAQLLDGILVSPALAPHVREALIFHTNADFAHRLADAAEDRFLPYRAADHDVPYVLLSLDPPPPPTPTPIASSTPSPAPTTTPTAAPLPSATVTLQLSPTAAGAALVALAPAADPATATPAAASPGESGAAAAVPSGEPVVWLLAALIAAAAILIMRRRIWQNGP